MYMWICCLPIEDRTSRAEEGQIIHYIRQEKLEI